MAENFNEPEIREFVRSILGGEDVVARGDHSSIRTGMSTAP